MLSSLATRRRLIVPALRRCKSAARASYNPGRSKWGLGRQVSRQFQALSWVRRVVGDLAACPLRRIYPPEHHR
jgi:hypothetical protein